MSLALSPGGAGNHPPGHKGGGGLRQALGMGHAPQAHARMLLSDGALCLLVSRASDLVPLLWQEDANLELLLQGPTFRVPA